MALVLFGKMTAATQAAAIRVSVTAATLKVSLAATVAGIVTTKLAIVTMSAGTIVAVGSTMVDTPLTHLFYRQSGTPVVQTTASVDGFGKAEEGDESRWFFFPEGAKGPLMLRVVRLGAGNGECVSLQNAVANYHYDAAVRTVYLDNGRSYRPDLSATILPGDSPAMAALLAGHSAAHRDPIPIGLQLATPQRGLLVIEDLQAGHMRSQIEQHLNLLEEEYFQSNWPVSVQVVDRRDEAHKQGWTQFRITGQINSRSVRGVGQVPLVYAAGKVNRPWLDLTIGNDRLIDTASGSERIGSDGRVDRYPSGRLFEGLMRPWMGLHAIDTVRRDAAMRGIGADTRRVDDDRVAITLKKDKLEILYTISLSRDWIESITLSGGGIQGNLIFSYPANPNDRATEPAMVPSAYYHDQTDDWWLTQINGVRERAAAESRIDTRERGDESMTNRIRGFAARIAVVLLVSAGTCLGEWEYKYNDDFSTDQLKADSFGHSILWAEWVYPPAQPYLTLAPSSQQAPRLGFWGVGGTAAHLSYCFPLGFVLPSAADLGENWSLTSYLRSRRRCRIRRDF